jgi:hypothetical protein
MQVLENKLLLPIIRFKKVNIVKFILRLFRRPIVYKEVAPDIYERFDPITQLMERGNYEKRVF